MREKSSAVSDSVLEGTLSRSITVGSVLTTGAASGVDAGALTRAGGEEVRPLGARRGLLAGAGVVEMTRTSGRLKAGVCAG